MKIIIITSSDIRHTYFRKYLALDEKIKVLKSYCEIKSIKPKEVLETNENSKFLRIKHINKRNFYEKEFFLPFIINAPDKSNPKFIQKNQINDEEIVNQIIDLDPDLIIAYGCSIIKSKLIKVFNKRFLNLHLGLSPYYRGSGTNFWPFYFEELEFVGATFMYLDQGIDTGKIIHQIRARIYENDNLHIIGNRLISDAIIIYKELIKNFKNVHNIVQNDPPKTNGRFMRKKDFSENALIKVKFNLKNHMIKKYLDTKNQRIKKALIFENKNVTSISSIYSHV